MENNENVSKVFIILESIIESKAKYIEVSSSNGEPIFKIKIIVEDVDMVDFLDSFFDRGFKVKQIGKDEFDSFEGVETLDFNLK